MNETVKTGLAGAERSLRLREGRRVQWL